MTVQGRVSRYDGRGEVPKMQAVDTISSVDFLDIFICLCKNNSAFRKLS